MHLFIIFLLWQIAALLNCYMIAFLFDPLILVSSSTVVLNYVLNIERKPYKSELKCVF